MDNNKQYFYVSPGHSHPTRRADRLRRVASLWRPGPLSPPPRHSDTDNNTPGAAHQLQCPAQVDRTTLVCKKADN